MAKTNKRYVIWRRRREDLLSFNGFPATGTLQAKIDEAKGIVAATGSQHETILVLEVKKVVSRCKPPICIEDF
jgi:hypothetical protein